MSAGTLRQTFERLAAIGLLLVVPWIAWVLVLAPLLSVAMGDSSRLNEGRLTLAALTKTVTTEPEIARQLAQAQHILTTSSALWSEPSTSEVSAAIQARVRQLVAASRGVVQSTTDLPSQFDHGFLRLQVRVEAIEPCNSLPDVLLAIEKASPCLLIDDLHLQVPATPSLVEEPQVSMVLVITGYGRPTPG